MKNVIAFSLALAGCLTLAAIGCSDDDTENNAAGAAGAGTAGTGTAGTGTAGTGTAGTGTAGTGTAGAAGDGTGTGPGSTLKCTTSGKNAFETYGTAFGVVNEAIFTNVNTESTANGTKNLGDSFTKIKDAAAFKTSLANFLVFAYGGPNKYTGKDMTAAHAGMAITSEQYDYFVTQIVVPALTGNGVPEGDVSSCFAPILVDAAFKASMVGK